MRRTKATRPGAGNRDHAVVLGAGMAGLATAAALASRFDRVTVVDRDTLPRRGHTRTGVPQGRHAHVLLPAGLDGLAELLPGIRHDLTRAGVHLIPASEFRFYLGGGRLRLHDDALHVCGGTRPLVEGVVRDRLRGLPGVTIVERCDAHSLVTTLDRGRVTGVRLRFRDAAHTQDALAADLVVDTTGRGSRTPAWLADLGYPAPDEERMRVGVHYSTRLFHRDPADLDGCRHVVVGIPAGGRRGGLALAVEGGRWLVTLVGSLGERPPTDLDGFVAYAGSLWTDELRQVAATATPIGDGMTGAFHDYVRRRYDRLRAFPQGYAVSGDAVCSLSPVYAQGMTVAIGAAKALGRVLDRHHLDDVGARLSHQTRRLVDRAWTLATGADLAHPEVDGPRPLAWRATNAYVRRLVPVAHSDPVVADAFLAVNTLAAPPPSLLRPRVLARVLRGAGAAPSTRAAADPSDPERHPSGRAQAAGRRLEGQP